MEEHFSDQKIVGRSKSLSDESSKETSSRKTGQVKIPPLQIPKTTSMEGRISTPKPIKYNNRIKFSPRTEYFGKPQSEPKPHKIPHPEKTQRRKSATLSRSAPPLISEDFISRPSMKETPSKGSLDMSGSMGKKNNCHKIILRWNDLCMRYHLSSKASKKDVWSCILKKPNRGMGALLRYLKVSCDQKFADRLSRVLKKAHAENNKKMSVAICHAFQVEFLNFSMGLEEEQSYAYHALNLVPDKYRGSYISALFVRLNGKEFARSCPKEVGLEVIQTFLKYQNDLYGYLPQILFLASSNPKYSAELLGGELSLPNFERMVRCAADSGEFPQALLVQNMLVFVQGNLQSKIKVNNQKIEQERYKVKKRGSKISSKDRENATYNIELLERQNQKWREWIDSAEGQMLLNLGPRRGGDSKLLIQEIREVFECFTITSKPRDALEEVVKTHFTESQWMVEEPDCFFESLQHKYNSLNSAWARVSLDRIVAKMMAPYVVKNMESGYRCLQAYLFRQHDCESSNAMEVRGRFIRYLEKEMDKLVDITGDNFSFRNLFEFAITREIQNQREEFDKSNDPEDEMPLSTLWRSSTVSVELLRHLANEYEYHWIQQLQTLQQIVIKQLQAERAIENYLVEKGIKTQWGEAIKTKPKKKNRFEVEGNDERYLNLLKASYNKFINCHIPNELKWATSIVEREAKKAKIENVHILVDNLYFLRNLVPTAQNRASHAASLFQEPENHTSCQTLNDFRWICELVYSSARFLSSCCRQDGRAVTAQLPPESDVVEEVNALVDSSHTLVYQTVVGTGTSVE